MNKQELIEKYKNKYPVISMDVKEFRYFIELWEDMKQLDEPQKVTVPQFVADWIEYFKNCKGNLYGSTSPFSYYGRAILEDFEGDYEEVLRWIRDNSDIYARAWLDGYTVEKEPKYTVKIKSVNQYLVRNTDEDFLGFLQSRLKSKFTRKELEEAGLSDVFNSPLFEVEEVE
jgi:gp178